MYAESPYQAKPKKGLRTGFSSLGEAVVQRHTRRHVDKNIIWELCLAELYSMYEHSVVCQLRYQVLMIHTDDLHLRIRIHRDHIILLEHINNRINSAGWIFTVRKIIIK